jgi:ferredoxin-type protein NapF
VDLSRRQFLNPGRATGQVPVRPPWAASEDKFPLVCTGTGCGECTRACPEGIVAPGSGRLPEVDFYLGECTFCGACASACETGALDRGRYRKPFDRVATIDSRACLAEQGVECRVCGDYCSNRAIRAVYRKGNVPAPRIEPSECSGCGACIAPCPVGAIGTKPWRTA